MGNTAGKEVRGDEGGQRSGSFGHRGQGSDNFGNGDPATEPRRETKQEREARRAERDRQARLKERERSLKEEGVDGGYLVTLGTYTGPEDFNKGIVRQLMIERRLAPFWRGLNDHEDSWTEYQLVAAARGLAIPAPDEPPPDELFAAPPPLSTPITSASQDPSKSQQTQSIPMQRQASAGVDTFSNLSASHPAFSQLNSSPAPNSFPSPSPLFRGRAKTLVSLTSRNSSQTEVTSHQELRLPHEPRINGQPVEAYLYKDVAECPICFLYYPPYLNKTRCCDQLICSECFVQVKRPDPHPPEHLDPNTTPPSGPRSIEDEIQLFSEPATCPFCKTPEFGVSYESPPFRRGMAFANMASPMSRTGSSMSTSSSLSGGPVAGSPPNINRRRTHSLSATDASVITTDKVRPEWATKLAHAKAQAARRAASATALHTAAFMMGPNAQGAGLLGRRRRGDSRGEGPSQANLEHLLSILETHEQARNLRRQADASAGNGSGGLFRSRENRTEEIEELMMMEAIRQSIAAEEERKRKEEKEQAKQTKKDEKQKAKDQKKADKAAKKSGSISGAAGIMSSQSDSSFSLGSGSATTAASPLATASVSPTVATASSSKSAEEEGKGKGKASPSSETAARLAFNPINEPSSTLHTEIGETKDADAQRHLEQSRAILDTASGSPPTSSPIVRSRESSVTSSMMDDAVSLRLNHAGGSSTALGPAPAEAQPSEGSSLDPVFNFGSLAAMIDRDGDFGTSPSATLESTSPVSTNPLGEQPREAVSGTTNENEKQTTQSHFRGSSSIDRKHKDDVTLVEHHDQTA